MQQKIKSKIKSKRQVEKSSKRKSEILDYDKYDTTSFIDVDRPLKFEDLNMELPPYPPTQVVSIRLPTQLLNRIRAMGSQLDVPYQSLIKTILSEAIAGKSKRAA